MKFSIPRCEHRGIRAELHSFSGCNLAAELRDGEKNNSSWMRDVLLVLRIERVPRLMPLTGCMGILN